MGEKNWLELMERESLARAVLEVGACAEQFGLRISREDAEILAVGRQNALKKERRVELGESVLPKLVSAFCDSDYVNQDNYVEMLLRLQDIFFLYKNEMEDEITDDELLEFMKEQFETVCFGDPDYLEGTCLELFAQAIRAGYRGHLTSGGRGEFEKFDIVQRWDKELYLEALRELCWD